MIHRCETCPFWDSKHELAVSAEGICKAESSGKEYRLMAYSELGVEAVLITRKDFGCVIHPVNKAIA